MKRPAMILGAMSLAACNVSPGEGPVEIGTVAWIRDETQAFAKARETGKPVFLQFQEVPG